FDIPVGPDNRIEPGGPDQGQPTHFLPRRQWGVFTITVPKDFGGKRLTWTITSNGQTNSIPLNLNPLWVVAPFKDASRSGAPAIRFNAGGMPFSGPPRGIAQTISATLTDPLSLSVWGTDENSTRAPRTTTGLVAANVVNLSWSVFRGPAEVAFDPARSR